MFSKGMAFLTSFAKEERGALSIQLCLTGAAVAAVIVMSLVSVGPDVSRIYASKTTGMEHQAGMTEKVAKADQSNPGIFAHISTH